MKPLVKLFDEELEVNLSNLGYGRPVIPLKGRRYNEIGVSYLRSLTMDLDLKFDINYTNIMFDESDSITARSALSSIEIREPQSETGIVQTGLSLLFKL